MNLYEFVYGEVTIFIAADSRKDADEQLSNYCVWTNRTQDGWLLKRCVECRIFNVWE